MAFIARPDETASEEVAEMYEADREALGYVADYTRAFAHRPDVYAASALLPRQTLDALGVQLEAAYGDVEPGLRDALTVGRPIADS